ncbi:hypothetical protein NSPZN2_10790 [Nitrospira defluvii]|uniref:Uncharacterized protein n=1 Tax=Nitrospira defluvii TaxID=330214 RepID=A0ABM8QL75_9BACT|nr:hypothetical protein NSPZN2_10790 [Nitrospira defluvii]
MEFCAGRRRRAGVDAAYVWFGDTVRLTRRVESSPSVSSFRALAAHAPIRVGACHIL